MTQQSGVWGLNILADRAFDRGVLISRVKQLRPAYCVVLNNPNLAAELTSYTTVIVRRFPDDNAQNSTNGAEFVYARAADVPQGAYLYLGNEPGKEAAARLNTWTLEALTAAEQLGIKCCILNWATGNPEPADWDTVAPCVQHAVKGGHLIGVHEYWMNTPNQPPSYPYHVGRCFDAVKRFGGRWVVTETGANKDKGGGQPDPYAGWRTFLNEQMYAAHAAVLAPLYAERGIGACFFSYPDWDGHGFGVDAAPTFLNALASQNAAHPIQEQPPVTVYPIGTNPQQMKVNQPNGVTLRATPSTGGAKLTAIPKDAEATVYAQPVINADGYSWQRVTWQGQQGWCAMFIDGRPSFVAAGTAPAPAPTFKLLAPFKQYVITSRFNDPREYPFAPTKKQLHEGVDGIDGLAQKYGSDPTFHAGAAGTVIKVGYDERGYGNYCIIDFGGGWQAWYAHAAALYVREGQKVATGEILGLMGNSGGTSTGAHCHVTLTNPAIGLDNYVVAKVVDPAPYLVTW